MSLAWEILIPQAEVYIDLQGVKKCQNKNFANVVTFMQNTTKIIHKLLPPPFGLQIHILHLSSFKAFNSEAYQKFERILQVQHYHTNQ